MMERVVSNNQGIRRRVAVVFNNEKSAHFSSLTCREHILSPDHINDAVDSFKSQFKNEAMPWVDRLIDNNEITCSKIFRCASFLCF